MAQQASAVNGMPKWLEAGVEFRGRFEGGTGLGFADRQDFYYLHRIRVHVGLNPLPWLQLFIQPQNTEVFDRQPPIPSSQADRFDFHQAYIELSGTRERKWGLRVGRQEINFGQQRLVGSANWGNVSRSYDALRFFREDRGTRLEWFASTVVQTDRSRLDAFTKDVQLHGFHVSTNRVFPRGRLESYLLWKVQPREASETGQIGRTSFWTAGVRGDGPLPRRFDYTFETALQAGKSGDDDHRAWAGYYIVGYKLTPGQLSPRLFVNYSYATGDSQQGDGQHGTFDMLFPTNHAYYGWANRHAWRNLQEVAGGMVWRPTARWVINLEYHTFWLATRQDAFYEFSGRPLVRNPGASSAKTDQEVDAYAVFNASPRVQFVIGVGHVIPGPFLKESTPGHSATVPYLQWRYTL
jgi:hypothetical protein